MFNLFKRRSIEVPIQATCPYCSYMLEKFPSRKQKCSSCGKTFVVRTHYETRQKLVLTETDAVKFDAEKDKYYLDKSLLDGIKKYIYVDRGAVDKLVEKTRIELTKKFGKPAALGDVAWGVANRMSIDAMRKGDMALLGMIQFQMALYLHYSGKDGRHLLVSAFEIELMNYRKMGVTQVSMIATSCCEACKTVDGKIISIDEAIREKILPNIQCTSKLNPSAPTGWCSCCYSPVPDSIKLV